MGKTSGGFSSPCPAHLQTSRCKDPGYSRRAERAHIQPEKSAGPGQHVTRRLRRPRAWGMCAWFWLAGHTEGLAEKRRYLEAILGRKPNKEASTQCLR